VLDEEAAVALPGEGVPPGCPTHAMLRLLAREWLAHVLWTLGRAGPLHFGALRRTLPGGVTPRMLSARLREMQALGLVERRDIADARRRVEYRLSGEGRRLDAILLAFDDAVRGMALPAAPGRRGGGAG